MSKRRAIIIGAGPAGLTAAYELLRHTDVMPVVLELSDYMGGISRTVNYKGNRIDIGGHRFFSKSDRVMDWWMEMMPPAFGLDQDRIITYHNKTRTIPGQDHVGESDDTGVGERHHDTVDPDKDDNVMLLRQRKSRIYFLRKFFDYPISLSKQTLVNMGFLRTVRIGISYVKSMMFPIRDEQNLEHFFINRFGNELYETFFKSYTEKVWGVQCSEIPAEWGAQRIKGLSIKKALAHAWRRLKERSPDGDLAQRETETSLIEQFLYPKYGPGQMWDIVANEIGTLGGQVITHLLVDKLLVRGSEIVGVEGVHVQTGERETFRGDYVFSTMPMKDLVRAMDCEVPTKVRDVSEGLMYRDFITVGLLLDELKVKPSNKEDGELISDNWIYIQEPDVLVGRMQIFNNWTPYLVNDPSKVWIGLEYFCYETDTLWQLPDNEMIDLAIREMDHIGIIERDRVRDGCVLRMPKTYPAYFGTYDRFDELREFVDGFENLFLVGRNGMHRYNNQDHSMLTSMVAVENIAAGRTDKSNIWAVNTEQEYHEQK